MLLKYILLTSEFVSSKKLPFSARNSDFTEQISYTELVIPWDTNRHRYKKVALIVDNSPNVAALTPDSGSWVTGPFDMLDYKTGEPLTGKEFRLDWTKKGDDQWAQVKFIEIDYIPGKS